ncbi:MAG: PAS domain S-box protein, partial [Anaerolineales bacterium]|nr:PAS domain S-box protein [Anaerolineales bacterium]
MHNITDLKRAEAEMDSLARFPAENPNPVLRVNQEGNLLYINEAGIMFLPDWNLVVGEPVPQALRQAVVETLSEQGTKMVEVTQRGRVISFFVAPVVKVGYANLYGLDVTERKRSEEALRESEEKYRGLVTEISEGIFVTDDRGALTFANPALARMMGFEYPDQMMGRNFVEFVVPSMVNEVAGYFRQVIKTGQSREAIIVEVVRADGTNAVVEVKSRPIMGDGRVAGTRGVLRDITKRKRAEEALRESEERYRRLVETLPDGVIVHSQGRVVFANPASAKISGAANPAELIGKPVMEFVHPDYRELALKRIQQSFSEGIPAPDMEEKFLRLDGTPIDVQVTAIPFSYAGTSAMLTVFNDITERKQAETERQALLEIMQGLFATKSLQEFLQLIHHSIAKAIYAENFSVVFHNKSSGLFEEVYAVDQYDAPMPPSKLEKSIISYVFRAGEPLLLTQAKFEELAARGEVELVGTKPAIWMGAPLKTPSETIGVIVVQNYEDPDCYSERDREFLASVGMQVSLAIERKQAEDVLLESEDKFRNLFNNAEVGMFRTRLDGSEILDMNEKFLRIFGLTREEMQGSASVIHWADPREREEMVRRLETEDRVTDFECGMLNKQGEVRRCLTSLRLYRAQEILEGSILDITKRKQAEQVLQESEAKLKAIFEMLPIGISILDSERKISYVNPALESILDLSRERLLKEDYKLRTYLRPDGTPMPAEEFTSVRVLKEQRAVHNVETGVVKEDGNVIWVNVSAVPVAFPDWKVVIVTSDITERKEAEQALAESEIKFRWLYEYAPSAYHLLTPDGTLTDVNRRWCDLLGYRREEVLGKAIFDFVVEEEREAAKASFEKKKHSRQTYVEGSERNFKAKDGALRTFKTYDFFVMDQRQNITSVQTTIEDITERKRAEEALRKKDEHYRNVIESIFRFVPEGLLVLSEDFSPLKQNKAFGELVQQYAAQLGYTEQELAELITEQVR